MTKYYFVKTNAYNAVVVTDGSKYFVAPAKSDGTDEASGVDLYTDNTLRELTDEYQKIAVKDYLYNMDDVIRDYPDDVYDLTVDDEDFFDVMIELVSVE